MCECCCANDAKMSKTTSTVGTDAVEKCCYGELVMWKDAKKSGGIFGAGLVTLYLLQNYTVLGLFTNALFFATSICCLWVLIRNVISAFNQQQGQPVSAAHPFQFLLDSVPAKLRLSEDDAGKLAPVIADTVNCAISKFVKLVLVDSWLNSTTFVVVLYFTRGLFAAYDALSLITFIWICSFSVPFVYKQKEDEFNMVFEKVMGPLRPHLEKVQNMVTKFKSAKQTVAEADKDE